MAILKKNIHFILLQSHLLLCYKGFCDVSVHFITSASRYHSRYQSRSSMYFRGLVPRNFAELTETIPIAASLYARYCMLWNYRHDRFVHIIAILHVFATSVAVNAALYKTDHTQLIGGSHATATRIDRGSLLHSVSPLRWQPQATQTVRNHKRKKTFIRVCHP